MTEYHTTAEAAVLLRVSLATAKRLVRSGELPTVQVRSKPGLKPRTRVRDDVLREFIKARMQEAS